MIIVDAHEDLAWNYFTFGRDYSLPSAVTRLREAGRLPDPLLYGAMLGWSDWLLGRVAVVLATLHAGTTRLKVDPWDNVCYTEPEQASRLYRAQLDYYRRFIEQHHQKFVLLRSAADLDAVLAGWEGSDLAARRVGLVLLMEGAEAVRAPDELPEWHEAGLRMLGPAWDATRYAGSGYAPGPLTSLGRRLLEVMAELGMMLDLSHMAESAGLEALDMYPGVVLASHSNPRALVPHPKYPERHLSDLTIDRLAERQAVIGIVPYNRFLRGDWEVADGRQEFDLRNVAAHIDYICQRVGDARHVGIGSDFDGGHGSAGTPVGLDSVADLRFIGDALRSRGYSDEDVRLVLGENWLRLLRRGLPES